MTYSLGIDAGGTKTTCVLADQTSVLARASAGSIKIMRVSESEASANLVSLLQTVAAQSGVALGNISSTCIGLAGNTVPRVEQWTRAALQSHLPGSLLLCGDEEIALDGAFWGGPGVLVLAGTGSNVVGRAADGTIFHLGGWGPVLSDEGSGYWIGLQAVRAVLHALERDRSTQLLPAILAEWKISNCDELVDMGNLIPGPDFSRLTPLVAQCAGAGDAVAMSVLAHAGRELGTIAIEALQKVAALEKVAASNSLREPAPPLKLAFAGSIVENIPQVRQSLIATVHQVLPTVQIHSDPVDAVMGALWRARCNAKEPLH